MMRIKKTVVVLFGVCVFSSGCSGMNREIESDITETYDYGDESGSLDDSDYGEGEDRESGADFQEGEREMGKREITEEQIELLCNMSVNEEKVRRGDLYDWQIEVLNQYDYAMDYLARKYPSHSFKMVSCENKNKLNSYTTFMFVEKSEEEDYYSLYLYVDETGGTKVYEAKDNYYGRLYEEELSQRMLELVQGEFPECIRAEVNLPYVQGEEYGESVNLDSILDGGFEMYQSTSFVLCVPKTSEEDYAQKFSKLETYIKTKKLAGSYGVEFVNDVDQEEVLYEEYFFGE